jgi:hypothetical protein
MPDNSGKNTDTRSLYHLMLHNWLSPSDFVKCFTATLTTRQASDACVQGCPPQITFKQIESTFTWSGQNVGTIPQLVCPRDIKLLAQRVSKDKSTFHYNLHYYHHRVMKLMLKREHCRIVRTRRRLCNYSKCSKLPVILCITWLPTQNIRSFPINKITTSDNISKPTNARKCMQLYYTHCIPSKCFGHSCGHLQGGVLQGIDTSKYYKSILNQLTDIKTLSWQIIHYLKYILRKKIQIKNTVIYSNGQWYTTMW